MKQIMLFTFFDSVTFTAEFLNLFETEFIFFCDISLLDSAFVIILAK